MQFFRFSYSFPKQAVSVEVDFPQFVSFYNILSSDHIHIMLDWILITAEFLKILQFRHNQVTALIRACLLKMQGLIPCKNLMKSF